VSVAKRGKGEGIAPFVVCLAAREQAAQEPWQGSEMALQNLIHQVIKQEPEPTQIPSERQQHWIQPANCNWQPGNSAKGNRSLKSLKSLKKDNAHPLVTRKFTLNIPNFPKMLYLKRKSRWVIGTM